MLSCPFSIANLSTIIIITLTQPKGQIPDYGAPVVLHDQTPSVEDLCNKLHKQVDGIYFFWAAYFNYPSSFTYLSFYVVAHYAVQICVGMGIICPTSASKGFSYSILLLCNVYC